MKTIIGVLLSAVAAFGGTSNCPTASLLSDMSPIGGGTTVGCAAVEVTFNSFGTSGAVNSITNPGLSASDTSLFEAGAGILAGPSTSTFAATSEFGSGTTVTDGLAADFLNDGSPAVTLGNSVFNNYALNSSGIGGIFPVTTTFGGLAAPAFAAPTFAAPTFASPTATLGGCSQLGMLTGSCSSGGIQASSLFSLMTSTNTFNASVQPTSIDLASAIDLTSGGGTADPSFLTLDDSIDAPEPSTFILLGTAIAYIGLLRYRRSKTTTVSR